MQNEMLRVRHAAAGWWWRVAIVAAATLGAIRPAPAAPPAPGDILVIGLEPGRHRVYWLGLGGDYEYEIHRQEGDGDYSLLSTEGPVALDASSFHEDDGLDADNVYRYKIRAHDPGDDSLSAFSAIAPQPVWVEKDAFRIFYNLAEAGPDPGCPTYKGSPSCLSGDDVAEFMADLFQGSLDEFVDIGFDQPANPLGTDLFPVNLKDCDPSLGGGCASDWGIGIAPTKAGLYDEDTNAGATFAVLVAIHELFHKVQGAHGGSGAFQGDAAPKWVTEGQARAMQDLLCVQAGGDPCLDIDDDPGGSAPFYGQANSWLGNPNQPINEASYTSALFWTFLCQRYGSQVSEPERGVDLLLGFWQEAKSGDDQRDGIEVLDAAIAEVCADHPDLCSSPGEGFREAFEEFCVVNYTKDLTAAPDRYRYFDEGQPPGPFDLVKRELASPLGPGDQVGPAFLDVRQWGARYFEVLPQPGLDHVQVEFHVDDGGENPFFIALIAAKGGDVVEDDRDTAFHFSRNLPVDPADPLDAVAVVVVGLDHDVNFHYSFNASDPTLTIVRPLKGVPSYVGPPGSPGKFIAVIEVLNPDASAVLGLKAGDFAFQVGGQAVTDVIQSFYVGGGQYWFVLRAPVQPADGSYDFTADWSSLSGSRSDAVTYGVDPVPDIANAIVVDRTPSMADPSSKIQAARAAARVYVDSYHEGDKLAVVSFFGDGAVGCDSEADLTLRPWDGDSRDDAYDAIDAMNVPAGKTSVGGGLLDALAELGKDFIVPTADSRAIFLLSDGLNNCGSGLDDFMDAYDKQIADGLPVPVVHTVAIGPDANRPPLQQLAADTGGDYMFVPEPGGGGGALTADETFRFDLIEKHRMGIERLAGESQVNSERGTTPPPFQPARTVPFLVDKGATELVVALAWGAPFRPTAVLRDPSGGAGHPPAFETGEHRIWRIALPEPGAWKLELEGAADCPTIDCPASFIAEGSVRSALTLEAALGLPVAERVRGNPVPILAALSDTSPVLGASVKASVEDPLGVTTAFVLLDDGAHGDGNAGDGVYAATFHGTSAPGTYRVLVEAAGATPLLGPYRRQQILYFHLLEDENRDRDCISRSFPWGLPDGWERRMGLDPSLDDGAEDPDGDELDNCSEFHLGTSPRDPDTDDDGEADGSEIAHGRSPLDPTDGSITFPRACAYPGVGRVVLMFNRPRGALALEISRAVGERGAFKVLVPSLPLGRRLSHIDDGVANGTLYRYRLVSLGVEKGVRSAPSEICSATPRTDPLPPRGTVTIDDGAAATSSRTVTLSLLASDVWDPMDMHDFEEIEPGTTSSGVAECRVSNRSDFAGASWMPLVPRIEGWTIEPNRAGVAVVYARFRDREGNISDGAFDSILVRSVPSSVLEIPDGILVVPCGIAQTRPVLLSTAEPVVAVSLGLRWDPALLDVVAIRPGPDLPAGGSDLFRVVIGEAPLSPGEALVELSLRKGAAIEAGEGRRILDLRLVPGPGALAGGAARICFADGIGDPARTARLTVHREGTTAVVFPEKACGSISLAGGPCSGDFRRGDANADGVLDISDPISILGFLFLGAPADLSCRKAADTNDSGALDISDGIHFLNHLFLGGEAPGRPFPGCGQDPTPDEMTCENFGPCQ